MSKSNNLKILTIIGARPQFIKSSVVSRVLNSKKYKDIKKAENLIKEVTRFPVQVRKAPRRGVRVN